MNRQNFIQATYLENVSTNANDNCGQDYCECETIKIDEQKQHWKTTHLFQFTAIVLLAFICAFVFSVIKMKATKTNILLSKRNTAISCGTINSINKKEKEEFINDHRANNKQGNNCPHQQLTSSLGALTDFRRRLIKHHNC